MPAIAVTRPNWGELKFVSVILPPWIGPAIGAPQLNVLSKLNVSMRSSSVRLVPKEMRRESATSTDEYPGARTLLRRKFPERARVGQRERSRVQPVVERLVAVRVVEHLVHALILDAAERAVLAGDDIQRLAGARAEDARDAPVGEQGAQPTVRHLWRLHAGDEHADVRSILIAHAAVERKVVGIGKPVGYLREAAGLECRIPEAAGHGVIAAEAQPLRGATLERQLQALVVLCSYRLVDVHVAEQARSRRILT